MADRFRLPYACLQPGSLELLMKVADHFGFAITVSAEGVHAVYDRPAKRELKPARRVSCLPIRRLAEPQEEERLSA